MQEYPPFLLDHNVVIATELILQTGKHAKISATTTTSKVIRTDWHGLLSCTVKTRRHCIRNECAGDYFWLIIVAKQNIHVHFQVLRGNNIPKNGESRIPQSNNLKLDPTTVP